MTNPKGEGLQVGFEGSLRLEFHGAKVTSDAGLLAYRDLDEALVYSIGCPPFFTTRVRGATSSTTSRRCSRLAGYEDVNDAHRLSVDPTMRRITGKKINAKNAAFAKPEIYEYLEERGFLYAIRLPANEVLQKEIRHLLTRPVGRPPRKLVVWFADFKYQAASWDRPRRVIAKVEWHCGELFPTS